MGLFLTHEKSASFLLEDLIHAVNDLLVPQNIQGINKRTVRFYISRGLIPPAIGPSRHARYNYEHLIRIIAIKKLQIEGLDLNQIQETLSQNLKMQDSQFEKSIQEWIEKDFNSRPFLHESSRRYNLKKRKSLEEADPKWLEIKKIKLTANMSLEIAGDRFSKEELKEALKQLERLIAAS